MAELAVHHMGDAAGQGHSRRGQVEPLDVNRPQRGRVPQFLEGAGVFDDREHRFPIAAARAAGAGEFNFVTGISGFVLDTGQRQVQALTNDSRLEPSEREGREPRPGRRVAGGGLSRSGQDQAHGVVGVKAAAGQARGFGKPVPGLALVIGQAAPGTGRAGQQVALARLGERPRVRLGGVPAGGRRRARCRGWRTTATTRALAARVPWDAVLMALL